MYEVISERAPVRSAGFCNDKGIGHQNARIARSELCFESRATAFIEIT